MKTNKYFSYLSAVLLIVCMSSVFTSCSKDDVNGESPIFQILTGITHGGRQQVTKWNSSMTALAQVGFRWKMPTRLKAGASIPIMERQMSRCLSIHCYLRMVPHFLSGWTERWMTMELVL